VDGKDLRFYDAEHKCTFTAISGVRDGYRYENYRKLMPWEYPDWAIEAQKLLEN